MCSKIKPTHGNGNFLAEWVERRGKNGKFGIKEGKYNNGIWGKWNLLFEAENPGSWQMPKMWKMLFNIVFIKNSQNKNAKKNLLKIGTC